MEIERKFLVRALPFNLDAFPSQKIRQAYIALDASGTEVRIRQIQGAYWLTVKSGGMLSRTEIELSLSEAQWDALWPLAMGRSIEKTRFRVPCLNRVIEVDVFENKLAGLILAEIEFESESQAASFELPEWLGEEVTHDARYKNKQLSARRHL